MPRVKEILGKPIKSFVELNEEQAKALGGTVPKKESKDFSEKKEKTVLEQRKHSKI